ncbi:hypothetical protein ACFYM7_37705 [Streptomyces cyaneofuscatus]|uniref:hypothetical protein n=1 Tax=Streptomyces cyaneofuscatus TaxID=66883 RepID=UPI0036C41C7B
MNENEINAILRQADEVAQTISNEWSGLQGAYMPGRGQALDFQNAALQACERIAGTEGHAQEVVASLAATREACYATGQQNWIHQIDQYMPSMQECQNTLSSVLHGYHMLNSAFELGANLDALHDLTNSTFEHNSRPEHTNNHEAMRRQLTELLPVQEYTTVLLHRAQELIAVPYSEAIPPQVHGYLETLKSNLDEQYAVIDAYVTALNEELAAV